jgi:hypothetical protein
MLVIPYAGKGPVSFLLRSEDRGMDDPVCPLDGGRAAGSISPSHGDGCAGRG